MAGPGRLKLMDVPAESRRSIHSRGILVARLSARLLRILPALPLLAVLGACGCNPAVHVIIGAGLGAGRPSPEARVKRWDKSSSCPPARGTAWQPRAGARPDRSPGSSRPPRLQVGRWSRGATFDLDE